MNFFSPAELTGNYAAAGKKKALLPAVTIFLLAVLAGGLIALAGAGATTATHNIAAAGIARLVNGVLFPFGLMMIVLLGAELFTGNCLMVISVLDRQATLAGMLRNWLLAYGGNFVGSVLVAAGCAYFGQFNYSAAGLAVSTVKLAAAKCALPFGTAFVMGIFCNLLVCAAVLLAFSAKDAAGKILAIFPPVCLFVLCGFEHSVANMYYIPAGLFALNVPDYAAAIAQSGLDLSPLTWGNFLLRNLLPVTLGNIVGGTGIGAMMWYAYLRKSGERD
ncbi:MAG: formate/nitrite transporter family protein [Oscillibacter sp.]